MIIYFVIWYLKKMCGSFPVYKKKTKTNHPLHGFFFLSKWTFLFSSAIWHCTHLDTDTGICVSYWKPVALSVKLSPSGSYWITAAEVCGDRTLHSHLGTSGAMWDQSWLPVFNGGGLYRGAVWLPTCSRPLCKCAVRQLYQTERLKKKHWQKSRCSQSLVSLCFVFKESMSSGFIVTSTMCCGTVHSEVRQHSSKTMVLCITYNRQSTEDYIKCKYTKIAK